VALWLLVAIAAIGLQFSLEARERRLAAINIAEWSDGRAAADAGLVNARASLERLLRGEPLTTRQRVESVVGDPWGIASALARDTAQIGDERYAVRYTDLGTMLNVNRAEPSEIRMLLVALGIDAARAEQIADAIADWRDEDDLRHTRGAEHDDYLRAGADQVPANRPFQDVGEVGAVMGMTPELLKRVRPYLTTLGSGQVNVNAAPREVLTALPGMTPELLALLLHGQGSETQPKNHLDLANRLSAPALAVLQREMPRFMMMASFGTNEVEARITGWRTGSPVRARLDAVLVRGGTAAFVVWRKAR
jgi:hypothetical protein